MPEVLVKNSELSRAKCDSIILGVECFITETITSEDGAEFVKNIDWISSGPQTMANFLKNSQNLLKLVIFNPSDFSENIQKIISLPRLKHLEIYNSVHALQFIDAPRLESLQIFGIKKYPKEEDFNSNRECGEFLRILNCFMEKCKSLRNLHLHYIFINPTSTLSNWPTTLETLTLDRVNIPDGKLSQFLLLQKHFLRKLAVRPLIPYELDRYLKVALNKLNLKSLTLDTETLRKRLEVEANNSIETLTLSGDDFNEGVLKLIKSLRNLKHLKVDKFPTLDFNQFFFRKFTITKILNSEDIEKIFEIIKNSQVIQEINCRILTESFKFENFENILKTTKIKKIKLEIFDEEESLEILSTDNFYPIYEKNNENFIVVGFQNSKDEICEIHYKFIHSKKMY